MTMQSVRSQETRLPSLLLLIFLPAFITTLAYAVLVGVQQTLPPLLVFYLCATLLLFPMELGIILFASKKEYGKASLRSALSEQKPLQWWKILLFGSLLFGFAGLMSITVAPWEARLVTPLQNLIPDRFDWNSLDRYPRSMVIITSVYYFLFNGFVGPIVEELYFRGYLTSHVKRFGKAAALIVTILFSLYHLWAPFANIFRIAVFLPAAYAAWKLKNIYVSMVCHCLCNIFSVIIFIAA
ncbi:MAG: CPBP family intramembrane metalloprotease [Spirochaetales bacterium]|jgi:membrane protease YdiL (CAAX protease family)|nr:CPBP family intramembrane metalloprotease [Spirochaetales bacterium]